MDFSEIKSISRSFAHQYLIRKRASKKKITEINIPSSVAKMFSIVDSSTKKDQIVDPDSVQLMTI